MRLKGGDCFVFGRGGEELEALCESGIDFEVIPGITSALAVPAYAGIPVTHRDYVSSVHIITGHTRVGGRPRVDFKACVKAGGTLVFLMGAANLEVIASGLLDAGMDPNIPCAVIENGTLAQQKRFLGRLADISEKAASAKSPSVIVVGEVCGLAEKLDWFSRLPLSGKTVCVTRPIDRAVELTDRLRALGAQVRERACIENKSLLDKSLTDRVAERIRKNNWCVFTSPFGVGAVFDALMKYGYDSRIFGKARIAAIGEATAARLAKYGIIADAVPDDYNSRALGEMLCRIVGDDESVLLLRADIASEELDERLKSGGISYERINVYSTYKSQSCDITDEINSGHINYVTFTSASSARAFAEVNPNADRTKFIGICIGERTAREAEKLGIRTVTADKATIAAIADKAAEIGKEVF